MAYFAVHYVYADSPRVDEVRPLHRAFLRRLADEGHLLASGPYVGASVPSALLILRGADASAIAGLLVSDPFRTEGLIASREITEWDPVIGVFAEQS